MYYRKNAQEEVFEEVTVLGKPMLFTPCCIDRNTVPKSLYMYEVRHDDDGRGDPVQIAKWVMVNHWGTLISSVPIKLDSYKTESNAFRDIDPEKDWHYEGVDFTVKEYMERHPPKKDKDLER